MNEALQKHYPLTEFVSDDTVTLLWQLGDRGKVSLSIDLLGVDTGHISETIGLAIDRLAGLRSRLAVDLDGAAPDKAMQVRVLARYTRKDDAR